MAGTRVVAPGPPTETAPTPLLPPRRWPRRLLLGLNIFIAVCLVAVGLAYGYVTWRNSQINRVNAPVVSKSASQPMTILLVGSDSRANVKSAQDKKTFGVTQDAGGQRSDTIMLIHLDPATRTATLMSIPRDLYVPIPGTRRQDRINTAFDKGPALLIQAIHDDLGIEVNHFMQVDFISFRGIVNAIGAVHVYFPTPARDTFSGLNITTPGCYGLDGNMALQYVRARHYMYYQNGRWHQEGLSDLARIKRQQDFMRKVASKAVAGGLTNPVKLNSLISSVVSNLTVDSGFHLSDMLSLAKRYRSINPAAIVTATVPTTAAVVGGADVLLLKQPDAQQAIDNFLGVTPQTSSSTLPAPVNVNPADVTVKVENGSGRSGQAATVASALRGDGFVVTGTGAADSYRYITPVIHYGPGQETKARYLQSLVVGGAEVLADPALTGTNLVLITGSSYSGLRGLAGASATTTPPPPAKARSTTATTTSPLNSPAPLPGATASEPPCPA
jgi:LCP family protein required for cell wall assembly